MKTEHKAIIERARLADMPPSYIAHELLVHDLVNAGLFELKNLHSPYGKLNEGQQQEVIDRLTEAATKATHNAIAIISSRNVETIEVEVVDAKFKKKAITITASIDVNAPDATALAKVPGKMCLLVLAPTDYDDGLDFIQPDRDQKDLALHVSELTGSLFDHRRADDDAQDEQRHPLGTAEELAERTGGGEKVQYVGKEFGEFTYDDAAQLIVLKAAEGFGINWMQSRLAIDTQQAETLLLRLVDNQVIELFAEGETSADNTYKVIVSLEDLGPNLSVE